MSFICWPRLWRASDEIIADENDAILSDEHLGYSSLCDESNAAGPKIRKMTKADFDVLDNAINPVGPSSTPSGGM